MEIEDAFVGKGSSSCQFLVRSFIKNSNKAIGTRKNSLGSEKLVDMECSYLTVDFFRKLPQDLEKGGNPSQLVFDRYNETYLHRIGKLCLCQCLLYIIHYRSFCHDFSYVMKSVLFIT